MSKGSDRRPGKHYEQNWEQIFGKNKYRRDDPERDRDQNVTPANETAGVRDRKADKSR